MCSKIGPFIPLIVMLLSVEHVAAAELPPQTISVIALSGERVRASITYGLNADCSSQGEIKARLIEPPKNGAAEIVNEKGFSNYGKDDQQYKCNEKPSDVVAYYYKSKDGFKGKDRFVIEWFSPNGNYRKRIFNVDVR
jgi:hypothetical protein